MGVSFVRLDTVSVLRGGEDEMKELFIVAMKSVDLGEEEFCE